MRQVLQGDGEGDRIVFWCAALTLGCGLLATAAAGFGCANEVLTFFVPDLTWILLVPSFLIVALGAVGICASRRLASKLFRSQLALFLMVLAVAVIGISAYEIESTETVADWIVDGCDGHRTTGLWHLAGRVSGNLQEVYTEYELLKDGWHRCRGLNPLVYDLSECGVRARLMDGRLASEIPMYGWIRDVQQGFSCGGFCAEEVPIFGLTAMHETLIPRTACALKVANWIEFLGRTIGILTGIASMPVLFIALILFCSARRSRFDFQEVAGSDPDNPFSSDEDAPD